MARQLKQQEDLLAVRDRFMPRAYLLSHPMIIEEAEGAYVVDDSGRRYLDFATGIAVANVGHRAPRVTEAIHRQVDKVIHTGPVAGNRPSIELAQKLALLAPQPATWQTLFVNSGAEAIENAIKLARHASGRSAIIAFERSFHGRTLLTATLTGKARPHKTQPGAMAPEVYHAPFPYPLRAPAALNGEQLIDYTIGMLDNMLDTRVRPDAVAGILVEPLQAEGGMIVPPKGFLSRLEEWCRAHQILLIVDEIQTGYGRTGRFFAFEHEGVKPDIITVAKSIADGLPLGAIIARSDLWDRVSPGDIGGTFSGNPVACAAGLAVLDLFSDGALFQNAERIGNRLLRGLTRLDKHPAVGQIRGLGAMIAIEFVTDRETLKPNPEIALEVCRLARERGLLLITAGIYSSCVRLLPPLTASNDMVDQALEVIVGAVDSVGVSSS